MSNDFMIVEKKQKMIGNILFEKPDAPSRFITEKKIIKNEKGSCILERRNDIKNIKLIIFAFFPSK